MGLTSFVGKLLKEDDSDILRDDIQALAQMIMDVEVSSKIGVVPYEHTDNHTRNGYRTRAWDTRVGTVELNIPRSPPAPTSLRCSTPETGPRRRCRRSSSRPIEIICLPRAFIPKVTEERRCVSFRCFAVLRQRSR